MLEDTFSRMASGATDDAIGIGSLDTEEFENFVRIIVALTNLPEAGTTRRLAATRWLVEMGFHLAGALAEALPDAPGHRRQSRGDVRPRSSGRRSGRREGSG